MIMEVRRLPSDVLEHHGIEGQRWGVRRYQNEDGTLTAAGRKRYGVAFTKEYIFKDKVKDSKEYQKVKEALGDTNSKDDINKEYDLANEVESGIEKRANKLYQRFINNEKIDKKFEKEVIDLLDESETVQREKYKCHKNMAKVVLGEIGELKVADKHLFKSERTIADAIVSELAKENTKEYEHQLETMLNYIREDYT